MTGLLDHLRRGIAACGLHGGRVLVAVSGGADSVALLHALRALRAESHLTLCAAHFDHGLRAESPADAAWTAELCRAWDVPCRLGEAGPDLAATTGGLEERARRARYRFLEEAARDAGCAYAAVGHHADDQVETVLHHLVRGTGLTGLRGMPRVRRLSRTSDVLLVRPLLDAARTDVRKYLSDRGLAYREDPSNAAANRTRNRLRHDILPRLVRDVHPGARDALLRLASQADELDAWLQSSARQVLDAALLDASPVAFRLDRRRLRREPAVVLRTCFRLLWERLGWPRQRMTAAAWDRLARLARCGGRADLPGVRAATRSGVLTCERRAGALES